MVVRVYIQELCHLAECPPQCTHMQHKCFLVFPEKVVTCRFTASTTQVHERQMLRTNAYTTQWLTISMKWLFPGRPKKVAYRMLLEPENLNQKWELWGQFPPRTLLRIPLSLLVRNAPKNYFCRQTLLGLVEIAGSEGCCLLVIGRVHCGSSNFFWDTL